MASPPPNSATPNGWRRRRSAVLRLPVDSVAAAQQPRDSQRTASHRSTTPRFPADGASPPNSPAPPLADVVDTTRRPFDPPSGRRHHCRWLYPWCQHPCYRRLASRCCPAEQRLASCVSNGARCIPQCLAMAINRHRVFPKGPRTGKRTLRGNISPLCIQIKLIMARIDPHVFVLPCKMPLGNTLGEDLAAKGCYFRPEPPNHA